MGITKAYIIKFYIVKKCTNFIFTSYKIYYKNGMLTISNADINVVNLI